MKKCFFEDLSFIGNRSSGHHCEMKMIAEGIECRKGNDPQSIAKIRTLTCESISQEILTFCGRRTMGGSGLDTHGVGGEGANKKPGGNPGCGLGAGAPANVRRLRRQHLPRTRRSEGRARHGVLTHQSDAIIAMEKALGQAIQDIFTAAPLSRSPRSQRVSSSWRISGSAGPMWKAASEMAPMARSRSSGLSRMRDS